jgi:hypothetical protein
VSSFPTRSTAAHPSARRGPTGVRPRPEPLCDLGRLPLADELPDEPHNPDGEPPAAGSNGCSGHESSTSEATALRTTACRASPRRPFASAGPTASRAGTRSAAREYHRVVIRAGHPLPAFTNEQHSRGGSGAAAGLLLSGQIKQPSQRSNTVDHSLSRLAATNCSLRRLALSFDRRSRARKHSETRPSCSRPSAGGFHLLDRREVTGCSHGCEPLRPVATGIRK